MGGMGGYNQYRIVFIAPAGEVLFTVGAPVMYDAEGKRKKIKPNKNTDGLSLKTLSVRDFFNYISVSSLKCYNPQA